MDMQTYLTDLEYLVNIDSGSDNPAGLNRMADFFSRQFRELGWIVEEHDLGPKSGTCVICKNREAARYDLMLIGHLDTVFPDGVCAERPFYIEGNKAFGPGVSDMKHGSLMIYYLMRELPAEIFKKLNIVVVFNPDEEIGSMYSFPVYKPYAEKTDYAFDYEAALSNGHRCAQRKGSVNLWIDFTGKEGHCGYVFTNGSRSAISEMLKWATTLEQLQSRERNTTVNIGVVQGGTKMNVVPGFATMSADIRYEIPEEADRVMEILEQLKQGAREREIGVNIRTFRMKPAMVPSEKGKAYLAHIDKLLKDQGIECVFAARGGLSDANVISQCGAICLDGMGPAGGGDHSPNEYMLIDTVMPAFRLSQVLIRDLAERKA